MSEFVALKHLGIAIPKSAIRGVSHRILGKVRNKLILPLTENDQFEVDTQLITMAGIYYHVETPSVAEFVIDAWPVDGEAVILSEKAKKNSSAPLLVLGNMVELVSPAKRIALVDSVVWNLAINDEDEKKRQKRLNTTQTQIDRYFEFIKAQEALDLAMATRHTGQPVENTDLEDEGDQDNAVMVITDDMREKQTTRIERLKTKFETEYPIMNPADGNQVFTVANYNEALAACGVENVDTGSLFGNIFGAITKSADAASESISFVRT